MRIVKTAILNISLDAQIKKAAEKVYSKYGLSLSEAVNVFIHQSCNVGGMPFDLRPQRPNAESLAAMAEAERISRDPSVKSERPLSPTTIPFGRNAGLLCHKHTQPVKFIGIKDL